MKFFFTGVIEISDHTPVGIKSVKAMIENDIGSWQGSLPPEEMLHIDGVKITEVSKVEDD